MTLSGRAAEEPPDIDALAAVRYGIVTHQIRQIGDTVFGRRLTAGPGNAVGHVEADTGTYRSTAASMSEADRREAELRRNGLPRRKATA